jgi:anti-sigma factor RsiW
VNCSQSHNLLHAFLDGELDLVRHLEMEHHLAECTACADDYQSLYALRDAMKLDTLYYHAPPQLAAGFRASLKQSAARPSVTRRVLLASATAAGLVVLVAGLSLFLFDEAPPPSETPRPLGQEVIASHVRSLQARHLTDIASADPKAVSSWFTGKVDFAPPVQDLSAKQFSLVGGRLDYLNNRPVAALVYEHQQHVINVFLWPAPRFRDYPLTSAQEQGYVALHTVTGGMNRWVVSDLTSADLTEFLSIFTTGISASGQPCHP